MDALKQIFDTMQAALSANAVTTGLCVMAMLLLYLGWAVAGYKAMRIFSSIFGALLGFVIGFSAVHLIQVNQYLVVLIPVLTVLLFGVLGFFLSKIGLFLVVVSMTYTVVNPVLLKYVTLNSWILAAAALVLGIILAVLAIVFYRPVIIIISSLVGGIGFSLTLFSKLVQIRWNEQASLIAVAIVALLVIVFGMIYQFRNSR